MFSLVLQNLIVLFLRGGYSIIQASRLSDGSMQRPVRGVHTLGRKRKNDKLSGMGQDLSDDKLVDSDLLIFSV
jgi:hypothetical protein